MADFDVLLLTSDAEGMPLVVLEAFNQGVPVVSTDVGCVGEIIDVKLVAQHEARLKDKVIRTLEEPRHVDINKYKDEFLRFIKSYRSIFHMMGVK